LKNGFYIFSSETVWLLQILKLCQRRIKTAHFWIVPECFCTFSDLSRIVLHTFGLFQNVAARFRIVPEWFRTLSDRSRMFLHAFGLCQNGSAHFWIVPEWSCTILDLSIHYAIFTSRHNCSIYLFKRSKKRRFCPLIYRGIHSNPLSALE